jgi:ActR/RegA family two-component response regulator
MPRILLAEDDDSLRGFLARALERAGYEVTACADGDEAAPAGAKVLSKPIHLREIVSEVERMIAA